MRNVAPTVFGRWPLRAAAYLSIIFAPLLAIAQTTTATTPASATPDKDVVQLDTYTVTGMRGGLETSIEEKRKAGVIMDGISSEDIGKFPDQNIAESLQRVNGVMIERSRGEGHRVSVRGLDPKFNSIKFNGRTLTSASGGRDFNFLLLQPEFLGALEVYKSASADMEEGALSATINARTLRPLDINQRRIVINVEESYEVNAKSWDPRVAAIFSDTYDKGKVGVLLGVGYNKRNSETHQFQGFGFENGSEAGKNLDYNRDGDFNDAVRFDHAVYYNSLQPNRDRYNAVATLQFKPSDNLELYLDGLFAHSKEDFLGNDNALRFTFILPSGPAAIQGSTIEQIGGENYATRLDADGVDYRNNNRNLITDERTYSIAAGFKWKGGDRLKVEGEIARADSRRLFSSLGLEVIGRANAEYDLRSDHGGLPIITFKRGYNPLNAASFNAVGFNGQLDEPTTDKSTDIRLDAHLDTDWGIFKSIDFGVKYSSREHYNGSRFLSVDAQRMAQLTNSTYTPNGIEGPSFNAGPFMGVVNASSTFLSAVSGHEGVQNQWLSYSPALLYARVSLKDIIASTPPISFDTSILTVKEDVSAAYLKGNFSGTLGQIPFTGNVGVRVVRTAQTSDGFAPDFSQIIFTQQGATTIIPVSTYTVIERSYTNVLPSLNVVFKLADDLDLRFAAARVMTRPDLGTLSTGTTVNANVLSINSNNPYVDPYEADQYDLSLEKYFGKGGLMTVTGFYKDIASFIEQARTTETHTVQLQQGGTTQLTFSHFLPANGAGASLQGVELGYQQQFTFLPKPFDGFGVVANYTYVKSGTISPVAGGPALYLTGVSKNNYNLIAYFENQRFSARLAYNYRAGFLFSPQSYFGDGENVSEFSTLDATVNVQLGRRYTVTFNAINLTDEYQVRSSNPGFARLIEDNGRRFVVSLRATF